jgi:predicted metal-dependent peptidase
MGDLSRQETQDEQHRETWMNAKHRKTLEAIFARPTSGSVKFSEIEALVLGLGGEVREGFGSRVVLQLGAVVKHAHRPHPGKDAKKYQVEEIRAWLADQGKAP